jgi:hypothetical protein
MRKEFEKLMKQNHFWSAFIKNMKRDIDVFFEINDPCDYLSAAFFFKDTPEGRYYWEYVQGKWDEYRKNI